MRGRGRGRGRGSRGRRGAISRGRGKKNMKVIESDEEDSQQSESQQEATGSQQTEQPQETEERPSGQDTPAQDENLPPKIDLEADISQLEAPTFTTLNRGPPEPMLHLRWDHKVSLIGEKVLNPMIHSCDQCNKPILIYGRMIPCKHVFCLFCARKEDKACPRCMDPVSRVEQTNLGTVFMCTHGGSRYGSTGCRRTYLSQRDLQAHINHRHSVAGGDASPKVSGVPTQPSPQQQPPQARKIIPPSTPPNDPRAESGVGYRAAQRTNLITVPIQQEPPPPPPPPPQQPQYHPQPGVGAGGYGAPPPPPPPPVQYGAGGYPTGYYQPAPPTTYPPPQYPPPPPPDQPPPPQQYWQHPPPIHQFYR